MTLRTTVDLDGLEWGDLLAFTDLGRAAGVAHDEQVTPVWSMQEELEGFAIDLPAMAVPRRPSISAEEGAEYAAVLDHVLIDGDARAFQEKLTELRDKLLGLD